MPPDPGGSRGASITEGHARASRGGDRVTHRVKPRCNASAGVGHVRPLRPGRSGRTPLGLRGPTDTVRGCGSRRYLRRRRSAAGRVGSAVSGRTFPAAAGTRLRERTAPRSRRVSVTWAVVTASRWDSTSASRLSSSPGAWSGRSGRRGATATQLPTGLCGELVDFGWCDSGDQTNHTGRLRRRRLAEVFARQALR
jgi:hypothetical protein